MTVVTRRTVVGGAAVAGAATAIGTVPAAGQVQADIEDFKAISEILTGIKATSLVTGDPIKIHLVYAQKAMTDPDFQGVFPQLLTAYRNNKDKKPDEIADALLNKSGTDVRYLARNIIIAWYMGSWCRKKDLMDYDAPPPDRLPRNQISHTVISPAAYTQGWVWRVAGAHPMGYSDLRFGYWGQDPGFDIPAVFFATA